MKKAFDQNVSRARPRLRVGGLTDAADDAAEALDSQSEGAGAAAEDVSELGAELKARVERAKVPQQPESPPPPATTAVARAVEVKPVPAPSASATPPPATVEIQTPPPELPRTREPRESREPDPERRREQLKKRL